MVGEGLAAVVLRRVKGQPCHHGRAPFGFKVRDQSGDRVAVFLGNTRATRPADFSNGFEQLLEIPKCPATRKDPSSWSQQSAPMWFHAPCPARSFPATTASDQNDPFAPSSLGCFLGDLLRAQIGYADPETVPTRFFGKRRAACTCRTSGVASRNAVHCGYLPRAGSCPSRSMRRERRRRSGGNARGHDHSLPF
jgi:hypothetical protein